MRRLANLFLRGLLVTAPVALTLYICWAVFIRVDRWLGLPIPGAGFVVTLALITLVGALASNLITRGAVGLVDRLLNRLPFVRLLYSSSKDLLGAFVGEKRRFNRAVSVALLPGSDVRAFGFITADSLARLGLDDHVAVYLPQSYNFAGQLVAVPRAQVTPLALDSADVMAFVVSGGVSALPAPQPGH